MKNFHYLIAVLILLFSLTGLFAQTNPRMIGQLVQYADGSTPPPSSLTMTAWFTERPTEVRDMADWPGHLSFITVAGPPVTTYAFVNLAAFPSPWNPAGGEHLVMHIVDTLHENVFVEATIVTTPGSNTLAIHTPVFIPWQEPTLPVELSSFTATISAYNYVNVMWITQSESNVNGFYIYRGTSSDLGEAAIISTIINATNTSQMQVYQFTDTELFESGTYYYWLNMQDMDGSMAYHGPTAVFFDNGNNHGIPEIHYPTEISSIYPNPFNPNATIHYTLAKQAEVSFVIYNARGQIIRHLSEGTKTDGSHQVSWNGKDDNGRGCSTGIYYIKMQAGKDSFMRKAMLVK